MLQHFLQFCSQRKWFLSLVFLGLIAGLCCIRNGHEWGDDFALYLSQANAILKGNTHQLAEYNTWSMQNSDGTLGPFLYPPGYPLFLTLYLKFLPFNWVGIKIFQWLFYMLGTYAFYVFIASFKVKLPKTWILCLLAIVLIHPKIIEFSDRIMSDLWFLVTVYLFFYFLYTKEYQSFSKKILIGLSLVLASLTRVNGLLLIGSWWIYLLSNDENRKVKLKDFLYSLPFVLVVFYFKKIDGQYESNHIDLLSNITVSSVLGNLSLYYKQIGQYVLWHLGFLPETGYAFGIILLFYFGFALKLTERLKLFAPILVWIFLNFALIVIWPIAQGSRYLLPIIPFIIWISILGFNDWIQNQKWNRWISIGFILLIVIQSFASMFFYRFVYNNNKVIGTTQNDIYEKLKLIVPDHEVVAFDKPRWLHLVTNKKCVRKESDSSFFKSKAQFRLITNKSMYSNRFEKLNDSRLDSIYGNADFTLYKRNDLIPREK
jgi:hypothetical protein